MRVDEFDFDLPQELIAQTPLKERHASRLLHLKRHNGDIEHLRFTDIRQLLKPDDLLVLNNTKVLPARLFGTKRDTNAKIEVLLLKQVDGDLWETLVKPGKKVHPGTELEFGDGLLKATCVARTEAGGRVLRFDYEGVFQEILAELGHMPLPPYIKKQLDDPGRYQTVYAKHPGSAAAPTAGLHFTQELLNQLRDMGVQIAYLTLHVGLGTFRPVQVETVEDHRMHAEYYELNEPTARLLNRTKEKGGRIIAVGTTSVRTLEAIRRENDAFRPGAGWTDIFIYPGFQFRAIDGMITNFHLPRSTLIMLVSAFAGKEHVLNAYREAIDRKYRFFSFGDAMIIT